jgi:4-diphosphocytidyl-2-C-methyl-D-erythritol kinase
VSSAPVPREVRVRVPGKVNLHLGVGPLRADGYHELATVFCAVSIEDELRARPAEALSLQITGEGAEQLPTGPENLVCRAAALLAARTGRAPAVAFELAKRIPVAGGMAGGSADAAAALVACAALWNVDRDLLPHLAAELGSDVAFPLLGGIALGTGRGEVLRPLPCAGELHWVFAFADSGISAGAAYRELDRLRASVLAPQPAGSPDHLVQALADGDLTTLAETLCNELQPAALSLQPSVASVLDRGRTAGALAVLVSGSGPTCAFLCESAAHARRVASRLDDVSRGTRTAVGPVPGASIRQVT